MWIKYWSACLLVTLASAEYLYDSNPYAHYGGYASAYDNYKPTNYKFEYGVSDPHTGDHKSQWEVKENGVVRGAYSLLEPDGTTRLVEYYADDTGFHADVKKLGTAIHDAPAPAPVHYGQLHSLADVHVADSLAYNGYGHGGVTHTYGAPIAAIPKIAAPIPAPIHAAPIAQVQHIAPVPQLIAPQIHHLGTPGVHSHYEDIAPQIYAAPEAHYHQEQVLAAPAPVLQHPAPFKISQAVHYIDQGHQGPVQYAQYAPAPGPTYAEPQQIVTKAYAEPQIIAKGYGPEIYAHQQPEAQYIPKGYPVPASQGYITKEIVGPIQLGHQVAQGPIAHNGYAIPDTYYAPPPPVATAKVVVAPKVQHQNPFARFFAPIAKYFAPAPKAVLAPVPTKVVVPTHQGYYADAPVPVHGNYDGYQGYKQEVVLASPHNYAPNPAYSYNHDY